MIRTNVLGVIYGMRAAGEQLMRQRSGGGIVNISSIVGEFPDPGGGAYAASKAAVDLLSRTGYRELRDHGIHVVNVKPALTDTAFSATARGVQRRMGGDPPEKVARWVAEALESGSANTGYR
jgi:NAD(P)-dependent dehydrogenase (short-subunit alcohol dehydrogenase family)